MIIIFSYLFSGQGKRVAGFLRQLGNMTYALYMIHFPIQLILLQVFYTRGVMFFNNTLFFFAYLALAMLVGFLSYRFFEMPVQNYLRKSKGSKFS